MSVSQSIYLSLTMFLFLFLVGNTQFYKRLCPFVGLSVGPVVRQHESKSWKISVLEVGKGVGYWVWMGVGCPCPPVRTDIVTPRHLFSFSRSGIRVLSDYLSLSLFLPLSLFLILIIPDVKSQDVMASAMVTFLHFSSSQLKGCILLSTMVLNSSLFLKNCTRSVAIMQRRMILSTLK